MTVPETDFERIEAELTTSFESAAAAGLLTHIASGTVKDVFRLAPYPDVAIAIARSPRHNSLVEKEHAVMLQLGTHAVRSVPVGTRCLNAPSREAIASPARGWVLDRRGFLMRYIDGSHVFPNRGTHPDPATTLLRSGVIRKAKQFGMFRDPARLAILVEDIAALCAHCRRYSGCLSDIQGMMERETGRFYLCDAHQALESDARHGAKLSGMEYLLVGLRELYALSLDPASEIPGEKTQADDHVSRKPRQEQARKPRPEQALRPWSENEELAVDLGPYPTMRSRLNALRARRALLESEPGPFQSQA